MRHGENSSGGNHPEEMSGSSGSGGADTAKAGAGSGGAATTAGAGSGGLGELGGLGTGGSTGGADSGGTTGASGATQGGQSGAPPGGTAGNGAGGLGSAGRSGSAGAPAGTAGMDPGEPCALPRDDCDRNATCRRVDGVDTCVCNADFYWDGVRCDGPRAAAAVSVGTSHTCAIIGSGRVRCWGYASNNALGTGDSEENDIGDDEPASAAPLVDLTEPVRGVAAGDLFTCVLLMSGDVRCWGYGGDGELGTGEAYDSIDPATVPNADLGGKAVALSTVSRHACALLEDGAVRCWGTNNGQLGYGTDESGALLTPAMCGDVDLEGPAVQIATSDSASCAVLESGVLTCWGYVPGLAERVGDDETPRVAGIMDVGTTVKSVTLGYKHACVVTSDNNVRCWGANDQAQLGYNIFSEPLSLVQMRDRGDVNVGGPVKQVVAGDRFTCALLMTGAVRCWGYFGGWAYGSYDTIGDNEDPADAGDAPLGGPVTSLSAGGSHLCALMQSGGVRCFGSAGHGVLGYGNLNEIGDDETPASIGDVPLF